MIKKLTAHGNSSALVIEKAILDLLNINLKTPLQISTDGRSIVISPVEKEAREKLKNRLSPGMRIFKVNLPDGIKNLRTFLLRGIPKERLLAGAEEIQAAQDPPEGSDSGLEEKEGEILFRRQSRLYRIRPLARASEGTQKVRLRLKASAGSHLDLLELESARQREGFAKMGARLLRL